MTTATDLFPLIRVVVAGQTFGVDMARVAGVERADRLKPPTADSPFHVVGYLPRRDGDCPVVRLADRLGLPLAPSKELGRVLLLDAAAGLFGLLVDRVSPVYRADRGALQALPESASGSAATLCDGVLLIDGRAVLVLNAEQLHPHATNFEALPTFAEPPTAALNLDRSTRLVVFGLPAERGKRPIGFGLPGNQVIEVTEANAPTPVPGTPPWSVGLIEWRGQAVPLVDPAAWVSLEPQPTTHRRVVIARTSQTGKRIGLLAGEVVRVLNLPVDHVPSRRELNYDRTRVKGVFELPGATMILPDLTGVRW